MNLRKSGLIAIVLREDDDLIGVALTDGRREVLLGTRDGMSIRFAETDLRPIGRNAVGVRGIELAEGDRGGCHVHRRRGHATCWPLPKTDMASAPPSRNIASRAAPARASRP